MNFNKKNSVNYNNIYIIFYSKGLQNNMTILCLCCPCQILTGNAFFSIYV